MSKQHKTQQQPIFGGALDLGEPVATNGELRFYVAKAPNGHWLAVIDADAWLTTEVYEADDMIDAHRIVAEFKDLDEARLMASHGDGERVTPSGVCARHAAIGDGDPGEVYAIGIAELPTGEGVMLRQYEDGCEVVVITVPAENVPKLFELARSYKERS